MKYTLVLALFIGAVSVNAIQLNQKSAFIDFDDPSAGADENKAASQAAVQKDVSGGSKELAEVALGAAKAATEAAKAAHEAAIASREGAIKAAEERKGGEGERVSSDHAAQAAITAEEDARKAFNKATNDEGTRQHELTVATFKDDNAAATKAAADTALNVENERIKWTHLQWQHDMDDDRAGTRDKQASDNLAWLEFVRSRDNAILEAKQAAHREDVFHKDMQEKMDQIAEERKQLVKDEQKRVADLAAAHNDKENAFWDEKHDAVDKKLQSEYAAAQNARLAKAEARRASAFKTNSAEEWVENMPEHVAATHDSSSNLVQDVHLRAAAPGGEEGAEQESAIKKLADAVKSDEAIEKVAEGEK